MTIGRYGNLTVEQARKEATRILGLVACGEDPVVSARAVRIQPTFRQLADAYIADHLAKRKASTQHLYRHYLDSCILPAFGGKKAADISHSDIARFHAQIGRCKPTTANRTLATFSGIFAHAIRTGQHPAQLGNPVHGVSLFKEKARTRYLSGVELTRLGQALREAETIGLKYAVDSSATNSDRGATCSNRRRVLDPFAIAAIRLLIFTGARLREILYAKWDYLDKENGILLLPDSKTGAKAIYLSAVALEIIDNLPRIAGNPYMFPGDGARRGLPEDSNAVRAAPRSDLKKPWAAICRAAALPGLRLHDLRHTFASYGAGARLGLPIIGSLLGHTQSKTTQRYAHLDADPTRIAVDTIGIKLKAAMQRMVVADH